MKRVFWLFTIVFSFLFLHSCKDEPGGVVPALIWDCRIVMEPIVNHDCQIWGIEDPIVNIWELADYGKVQSLECECEELPKIEKDGVILTNRENHSEQLLKITEKRLKNPQYEKYIWYPITENDNVCYETYYNKVEKGMLSKIARYKYYGIDQCDANGYDVFIEDFEKLLLSYEVTDTIFKYHTQKEYFHQLAIDIYFADDEEKPALLDEKSNKTWEKEYLKCKPRNREWQTEKLPVY